MRLGGSWQELLGGVEVTLACRCAAIRVTDIAIEISHEDIGDALSRQFGGRWSLLGFFGQAYMWEREVEA